jgi:sugar (pentulose or hexulose) kinase
MWNRMKASIVGKPLWIPQVRDAELLGGLVLVRTGERAYKDFDEAANHLVRFDEWIEPDLALGNFFQERYERYKDRCRRFMDALG